MSSQANWLATFEKVSQISSLHREPNERRKKTIACWIRALVVIHSHTRTDRECTEFSRARFKTARTYTPHRCEIQRRNCRWLSCAHMFELRTLFTLIEEHRNVCANSVLLSVPLCLHSHTHQHIDICLVVSGTYHRHIRIRFLWWAELAAQPYNVCARDGCLPREKKNSWRHQTHC